MRYIAWVAAGLEKPEKTLPGLAKVLGVHPSAIYKILEGTRKLYADELEPISHYIEEPIPVVGFGSGKRPKKITSNR